MANIERKLASIKEITEIRPIPEADAIECAIVGGGWPVVVKKGEFSVGDLALYAEPDTWMPHELAPFLSKGEEPKEYNGVKGQRLRTIRLRKQLSQGLLLPTSVISQIWEKMEIGDPWMPRFFHFFEGDDFTQFLYEKFGLQKWEAPIPLHLAGTARGNFPSYIPKTDEPRVQNLVQEIFEEHKGEGYEVTIKLDGSSCTIYVNENDFGVCSRNLDLKETEGNSFWSAARNQKIIEALQQICSSEGRNLALQMELAGEKIQGNQEKIKGQVLYLFNIFDISTQSYLNPGERLNILDKLNDLGATLEHAPILDPCVRVTEQFSTVEELLLFAEGPSLNPAVEREGLVFKSHDSPFSFKAISNKWLLKNKDK